jgi:HEAT repeat protein
MWNRHKRLIGLGVVAAALAVVLVGTYWKPSMASLVRKALSGETPSRLEAIGELERSPSAEAAAAMASLVQDADTPVAVRALGMLGRMRRADALPQIKTAMKDARPEVREAGAVALGNLGHRTDPQTLVAALRSDPSPDVRQAAARGIGLVRYWEGMPDLINALNDSSEDVRREAGAAIHRIWRADFLYRADDPPEQRAQRVALIRSLWDDYSRSPAFSRNRWGKEQQP